VRVNIYFNETKANTFIAMYCKHKFNTMSQYLWLGGQIELLSILRTNPSMKYGKNVMHILIPYNV
jgi:hypothetical protein